MSLRVDVRDYGAVGNGIVDDTPAFNAAITAVQATTGAVFVPRGNYRIVGGIDARLTDRVRLVGDDRKHSILLYTTMPTQPMIRGDGDGWGVYNLTLDMGDFHPTTGGGAGQAINAKGENWRINGCSIVNIYRFGVVVHGGSYWIIDNCYIRKNDPDATVGNAGILTTTGAGEVLAEHGSIYSNNVVGTGIGSFGNDLIVSGNTVSACGEGSAIFFGQYPRSSRATITNNVCYGGRGLDLYSTWTTGFEIWAPDSLVRGNVSYDNDGAGMVIGGQRTVVRGNHCYNNGAHGGPGHRNGIGIRYVNEQINANDSSFINNHCHDTRWPNTATMTQEYGICKISNRLEGLVFQGNNLHNNKLGEFCPR
jgi:hypothetical protein